MSERDFWNEVRRGFVTTVGALLKLRPDSKYTIDVRVVERHRD
jgi:regulation of enolase protein 1 (concanavalin A-like superfamily)